jgi:hypothetical protein
MKMSEKIKFCSYAYIQPTLFEDEIDVVCFWQLANRKTLERNLIICSSMKNAAQELKDITTKAT